MADEETQQQNNVSFEHKKTLAPSQEFLNELAANNEQTATEADSSQPQQTATDSIDLKDNLNDAPIASQPEVKQIEHAVEKEKRKAGRPVSLRVPSLLVLSLLGFVYTAHNFYERTSYVLSNHKQLHISPVVIIAMAISAIMVFLSLYLLVGKSTQNVASILKFYLYLTVIFLILSLLASRGMLFWPMLLVYGLFIVLLIYIKGKVEDLDSPSE